MNILREIIDITPNGCKLTVTRRCELLGIARHEAYNRPTPPNPAKTAQIEKIMKRIDHWHTKQPCCGVRGLRKLLRNKDNIFIGRKLIHRLMGEMGICAVYPKPNLSKPGKDHKKFPYLLRNKAIIYPNQVWAVDITYISVGRTHMYLTAIIDWYSRFIVGWELADTLEAAPVIKAMKEAMDRYGVPCIVNSDQGSQFTSEEYIKLLANSGIKQSMDGKARWVDNVIIERWFRSLKCEWVYINDYQTPRELRAGISGWITDYNFDRPHSAHDGAAPVTAYESVFKAIA